MGLSKVRISLYFSLKFAKYGAETKAVEIVGLTEKQYPFGKLEAQETRSTANSVKNLV